MLSQSFVSDFHIPKVQRDVPLQIYDYGGNPVPEAGKAFTFPCLLNFGSHFSMETFEIATPDSEFDMILPWWWIVKHRPGNWYLGDVQFTSDHYYDLRLSWSRCSAPEHLRVVVTTVETLKARWKKSRFLLPKKPRKHKAPHSRLWLEEKGVWPEFSRIVIDEAHRHNGTGARKATSGHKDFWRYLQSFEAKTHRFLSATPITT
ncbi:hypothetical protein EDC01DRAFT_778817 [Geopyxis carbonaria]|nr:hypothetical protein EDC01DRAFT_778817 [Geopyxis carbonaria]